MLRVDLVGSLRGEVLCVLFLILVYRWMWMRGLLFGILLLGAGLWRCLLFRRFFGGDWLGFVLLLGGGGCRNGSVVCGFLDGWVRVMRLTFW